jgi:hypothetical protein
VYSIESQPTFRRSMSPLSSGSKNNQAGEPKRRLNFNGLRDVISQKTELILSLLLFLLNHYLSVSYCSFPLPPFFFLCHKDSETILSPCILSAKDLHFLCHSLKVPPTYLTDFSRAHVFSGGTR